MSVRLGAFVLERPLGRGGAAVVWLGRHVEQDVPVAIKVLPPQADKESALRSFRNEVYAVARLDHPHIVMVLDHGEVSEAAALSSGGRLLAGAPYLVMELASGRSLDRVRAPLPWPSVFDALCGLLDALAHAHARGVVHRDLKPANVLICEAGDLRPGLKLTDFGLATSITPEHGEAEAIHGGTPMYMAPEQFRRASRDIGPPSDLYALGCLARWMVCGRPPFTGEGWRVLKRRHRGEPVPPLPSTAEVPHGFERWLARLLEKDPNARYRCAADAAWALRRLDPSRPVPPADRLPAAIADDRKQAVRAEGSEEVLPAAPTVSAPARRSPDRRSALPTLMMGPPLGGVVDDAELGGIPEMPSTWRGPPPTPIDHRLIGAGLGLYGLRTVPFVGREEQRDRLWSALSSVRTDGARCVVLQGPPGSGKTRLAEWIAGRAVEVGAATLLRASFAERSGPADGLGRSIARSLRLWDLEPAQAHLRAQRWCEANQAEGVDPEDVLALAALEGAPARFASEEERYGAMIRFLRASAAERPLVFWLDDAQWSLDALQFAQAVMAARTEMHLPVLLLLTVNEVDLAPRLAERERLKALLESDAAESMSVGPLSDEEQSVLVGHLLGLEGSVAEQLRERTAGNPLFAVHIVGDWVERGVLVPSKRGFVLREGTEAILPDALHHLWGPRLARILGDDLDERIAVELAAVLGADVDDVEWREACRAAGVRPADQALARGVERGLLRRRPAGFTFSHAMIRSSAERGAAEAGRLGRLHQAAADALSDLYGADALGVTGRIGRHLLAAGRFADALEPLLAGAGELAEQGQLLSAEGALHDWREAVAALSLSPIDPRRLEGEILRTRILDVTGRHAEALTAAKAQMALALEARQFGLVARAALVRADALGTLGSLDESAHYYRRARSAAEKAGDEVLVGKASLGLGHVEYYRGDRESARRRYRRAHSLFERLASPRDLATCLWSLGYIEMWRGHAEGAEALFLRMLSLAQSENDRRAEADATNALGELARREDDLQKAATYYREAVRIARACGYAKLRIFRLNLAHTQLAQGQIEVAQRTAEEVGAELERAQDLIGASATRWVRAICAAHQGDFAAFDEHAAAAMRLGRGSTLVDDDLAQGAEMAADVARRKGKYESARPVYRFAGELWARLGREDRVQAAHEAIERIDAP